jgi:ADP-heptose:LPS heptosyltransferase
MSTRSANSRDRSAPELPAKVTHPRPSLPLLPPAFGVVQRWSDQPAYAALGKRLELKRILVLKADAIGDFVLSLDAMLELRGAFPEAHITLACGPWNAAMAKSLALFNDIHVVNFFESRADIPRQPFKVEMLNGLEQKHFDLAVDIRTDPDTREMLPHLHATYKCGFESSPEVNAQMTIWLPHAMPPGTETNLAMHQTLLMRRLVHTVIGLFRSTPDVARVLRERVVTPANFDLGFARDRLLVACSTSSGRIVKNWPLARYRRVISWLCDKMGAAVLLLGGPDQTADSERLIAECATPYLASAAGRTTLPESMDLLTKADLYLGNDTGLTHLAARLGTPAVCIYSGIDPAAMWAPIGVDVTLLKAPVPCSPCHITLMSDCHHGQACVLGVSEEDVKAVLRGKIIAAHHRRLGAGSGALDELSSLIKSWANG